MIAMQVLIAALAVLAIAPVLAASKRRQVCVLVDPFSEYIGGIAKDYCKEHRIEVVECLSPYLCGYFKSKGSAVPAAFRAPEEGKEVAWAVRRGVLRSADVSRRGRGRRSRRARTPDSDDSKEEEGPPVEEEEEGGEEEGLLEEEEEAEDTEEEGGAQVATAVEGRDVVCVLSESDSGVSTALRLQQALGLRRRSFEGGPQGDHLAPQNKFLQNENGRRVGLKTVRQVLARQWSEAEPFVEELLRGASGGSSHVVVKPYRGVASDGVFKAGSLHEARQAFESLLGGARFGGGANDAVLLQEFVAGTEYAVDTVVRDGEIKVVALWRYRKQPANGAPFVYQCSELVEASGEEAGAVCDYAVAMLHAQGMRWGATHTEVMYTRDGPRLMEINPRWHAQHFAPLARRCLGYDAVTATMDAYFSARRWRALPARPPPLRQAGRILHLICYRKGIVSEVRHVDEIEGLQSTILLDLHAEPGSAVVKTVDIRTDCGFVLLCHEDPSVVEADYAAIVAMQRTIIEVEEQREAEGEGGEEEAFASAPESRAAAEEAAEEAAEAVPEPDLSPQPPAATSNPRGLPRAFIDEDEEDEEVYLKSYDYNNNNFNSVRNYSYDASTRGQGDEAPRSLIAAVLAQALQSKSPLLKLVRRSAALVGMSYIAAAVTIIAAPYVNDML